MNIFGSCSQVTSFANPADLQRVLQWNLSWQHPQRQAQRWYGRYKSQYKYASPRVSSARRTCFSVEWPRILRVSQCVLCVALTLRKTRSWKPHGTPSQGKSIRSLCSNQHTLWWPLLQAPMRAPNRQSLSALRLWPNFTLGFGRTLSLALLRWPRLCNCCKFRWTANLSKWCQVLP